MSLSKHVIKEDDFNTIIDPETNKEVPIKSAVGKQVIKNYLTCLKEGPESNNIVSTKMFYNNKPTINIKGKCKGCGKNVYSNEERVKKMGDYYHDRCLATNTMQITNTQNMGMTKGQCGGCGKPVFSTQERVNLGGVYYHEKCELKKPVEPRITTTNIVNKTQNMGSIKGKCGGCHHEVYSTQPRVNKSGVYYHEKCYTK